MKSKKYLVIFYLLIFALIGMIICGAVTMKPVLMFVGIGIIIATSIVLALITLILAFKNAKNKVDTPKTEISASESNTDENGDIFTSGSVTGGDTFFSESKSGIESTFASQISQAKNSSANSSLGEKIFACVAIALFVVGALGGGIICSRGNLPVGLTFVGVGVLAIFSFVMYSIIGQRIGLSKGIIRKGEIMQGMVTGCSVSSTTSVNGRVTKTVYKIGVSVNGEDKYAYSRQPYAAGVWVTVSVREGKRLVGIVDSGTPEN